MKKVILAYGTLACSVAAMIAAVAIHSHHPATDRDAAAGRGRPRSIRERMLEEREAPARGALLSQERSARDDNNADGGSERDAFDKWFYDQRKYPGTTLPVGAISKANKHADDDNF